MGNSTLGMVMCGSTTHKTDNEGILHMLFQLGLQ